MFDNWTIAVFMTMGSYSPAIFRGYRVFYVGVYVGTPKADNDNDFPYSI
jgi:hypothetical protein